MEGGYDHAVWGADVALSSLNLCRETLDGIRNHSWSRPAPATPEGEVVSWADRIAYVCHDFEDAVSTGLVVAETLPDVVRAHCGVTRGSQLKSFITAMIDAARDSGRIGMTSQVADALAAFRKFNYDNIYMREASRSQAHAVIDLLRALVEHYHAHPDHMAVAFRDGVGAPKSNDALRQAVTYVGGMTDRFACRQGLSLLNYDRERLPRGIDV